MENTRKPLIFLLVSAILSAILPAAVAYPTATTSMNRGVEDRKAPATDNSQIQLGVEGRKVSALDFSNTRTVPQEKNVDVGSSWPSSHPDLTQVITQRPEYSSGHNVREDPPPSEDDLQRHRRNTEAESASDPYEEAEEDDDSDMYMEPIEIEKIHVKPSQSQVQSTARPVAASSPVAASRPVAPASAPAAEVPKPEPAARPFVAVPSAVPVKDNHQMGQHFFPSFAPVFSLGHSRPHQLFHQEPFYNSKARVASTIAADYNPFRNFRESAYKVPLNFEDDAISTNILGSGNFGVLRGGTYYNEEDEYRGLFSSPFSNNGHGRPYYSNPRPQKYTNGDFFANFRDFAEINTPTKASYSQYIVVYINKNGTKPEEEAEEALASAASSPKVSTTITKPKNIFEQLTLLDQSEPSSDYDQMDPEDEEEEEQQQRMEKKTSLHKRKLALLRQEKLNKEKKSHYKSKDTGKDFLEPLLALS